MKNRTNLKTLVALERERERERESYTLVNHGAKEEVESTEM